MTFPMMAGRALAAAALLACYLAPRAEAAPRSALGAMPPLAAPLARRLARAEQWRGARFLDWRPGGQMLIAMHTGRRTVLAHLAAPQAKPVELLSLTTTLGRVLAPRAGPGLLYPQHAGGATRWLLREGKGRGRPFAAGQTVSGEPVWSADGRQVAFLSAAPGGASEAVYIDRVADDGIARLVAGALAGRWRLFDWSRDGRQLLLAHDEGPDEESLYTLRTSTGALTRLPLTPSRIAAARFAPGRAAAVYLVSNHGGEYQRLFRLNALTGELRTVSVDLPWDVEHFAASPDGHYLAYTVNVDGESHLYVRNRLLKLDVAVPWLEDGVIGDLQFDAGQRLALTFQSSREPPSIYVYEAGRGLLRRWLAGAAGPVGAVGLARARRVHYPTWDRVDGHWRMLSAYIYLPPGSGPAPVLIVLHSGAAGQFRPRWRPFLQFVANDLGYAVIAPNVRGSSGYGRRFRTLVQGTHRDDPVRDIGSLMVWISMQPGFDARRIVLMGRGFGGLLAVNCLATFDGHLLGAIDVNGISSLDDYVARAPGWR
jgi:dipeptidyl aminopeptidase/acylaminoacyl peptidase